MDEIAYGGWKRCARIVSGSVEAIVTLDVGPRVVRLGFVSGRNEFHENANEMGKTGGKDYRSYGGHRLWVAPEDKVRTYQPENEPVEHEEIKGWEIFRPKEDQFGIQKELRIKPMADGAFSLDHRVTNNGKSPVRMAPWAITVMAPGGTCLIPQFPFKAFPAILTPVQPVTLWSYTDMSNPRLTWGKHLIRMRHDPTMEATKIGTNVSQGYAAYRHGANLFVKRFACEEGREYPDFGCNFETFTRQDMLEFETLGPMVDFEPHQTVVHLEKWKLYENVELPEKDEELAEALEQLILDFRF